jgi:hypothetical protein
MSIPRHSGIVSSSESNRARLGGAAIILVAFFSTPTAAVAQASPACAPRTELLAQLLKGYKEEPTALGLANDGSLIEVLTSEQGSTWTIMISQPNGVSCLVAAGEGWEEFERATKGEHGA